jgi:hypothetical protein
LGLKSPKEQDARLSIKFKGPDFGSENEVHFGVGLKILVVQPYDFSNRN